MKYRKKPVVIDAIQFTGENAKEILNFAENAIYPEEGIIEIPTLEGDMIANIGDFIIKDVQGEFYPCKSDIFEMTYDEVCD